MQEFLNRVIHGNCSEIMVFMPSSCIDLTVTSPPYDNLRNYKGFEFPFEKIAQELYRVTKEGGIVVWVVNDATLKGSETGTSFKQALYFKEIGFNLHDTMIWKKANPLPNDSKQKRYIQSFEYMFIFSKGKPKTCNYLKEKCISAGSTRGQGTGRNSDGSQRIDRIKNRKGKQVNDEKARTNIWTFSNVGTYKEHPASFPEQLALEHILSWSNEGEIVMDCMCGSGTVLKMAYLNNRNFIGIDCSDEYVLLSQKRLEQSKNS